MVFRRAVWNSFSQNEKRVMKIFTCASAAVSVGAFLSEKYPSPSEPFDKNILDITSSQLQTSKLTSMTTGIAESMHRGKLGLDRVLLKSHTALCASNIHFMNEVINIIPRSTISALK